jgi:hypothetical protein
MLINILPMTTPLVRSHIHVINAIALTTGLADDDG